MLTDPKNGAGWAFGEKLTSDQMTEITTQLPNALDVIEGGAYALTDSVELSESGGDWSFGDLLVKIGADGVLRVYSGGTLDVLSGGALSVASGAALTLYGTANWPVLGSRTIYRTQIPSLHAQTGVQWLNNIDGSYCGLVQTSLSGDATTDNVNVLLEKVPDGAVLTAVEITLIGAAGHGALPAVMPKLGVYKQPRNGAHTQLGSNGTDASANVAAYEVRHQVTVSGLSETVDYSAAGACGYFLAIYGEDSTNAATGMRVLSVRSTYTATSLRQ